MNNNKKNRYIDLIISTPSYSLLYFFHSQGIDQEVGKVSATDFDSGSNGEVQYKLLYAVNANSKFEVDPTTGSISTLAELDYEHNKLHVLYIRVQDGGTPTLSSKPHQTGVDK